jgi:xanthine permease
MFEQMSATVPDEPLAAAGPAMTVHPVDWILPLPQLGLLGLQHVLVMYAGAVAVPLIIGQALKLTPDEVATLISANLFACGIATLIQAFGVSIIGIRLPIMMGATFASVGPMLGMIAAGAAAGASKAATLDLIYGSVIAAGCFGFLVAPIISRLSRLFPPIVTGTVILVIVISLMRIGIDWAAGGQPSDPAYGNPLHLGIAGATLVAILLATKFARGFLGNIAILFGVVTGAVIAAGLHLMNFTNVASTPWFGLVRPFQFGAPTFEPVAIVTMCIVMVVVMVESFGMFLAVGKLVDRTLTPDDIARGLRADAVGTIIGGVFNTFPYTSYSQNVGLVGVTGVRSRFVCVAGGCIMLVLGLSPKLAALVAAVPPFVLGGAGTILFGMVAATGVRILAGVDFAKTRNNQMIVAIAVSLGMIPLVSAHFFQFAPKVLAPLLNSGIVLTTISAVLLNFYYNGAPAAAADDPTAPGH